MAHRNDSDKELTTSEKISGYMLVFINIMLGLALIPFVGVTVVVHFCQYRVLQGDFITTAGLNEILSILSLLVLLCMFRQREVTREEIERKMDRFKQRMLGGRRESEASSLNLKNPQDSVQDRRDSVFNEEELIVPAAQD